MLMHETMVAQSLIESILAEAQKQNARPTTATISCGALNAINDEVLCFAFDAIDRETVCDCMRLKVEHKPLQGKCNNCKKTFTFEITKPICTACGSDAFDLLADAPLILEEIEFETE